MTIGIDIRALQTGHKYRGIGEVAKQVTNRILPLAEKDDNDVIFYEYDEKDDPKKLLDLPKGLKYSVVKLGRAPENDKNATLVEKLKRTSGQLLGSPIQGSEKSDVFLQFDYAFGVPKNTKTVLVKHDLIPLVFWNDFFESAWVPFKNKALRTTLRTIFANYRYNRILHRGVRDAHEIIAVSNSTKNDLIRYLHVPEKKINVVHLGVDVKESKTNSTNKPSTLPTKPYLLFVGAGDARRRVDDLVAAYNLLRAEGQDIQLVLVGENFKKPEHIPNKRTRDAVLQSSYRKDILTVGYVDDVTKQALFRSAIAFVYPTKYEGFGIPILESMLLGCPVITYKNSSTAEVGGSHAFYASRWDGIVKVVKILLNEPADKKKRRAKDIHRYASQFSSWNSAAEDIYKKL